MRRLLIYLALASAGVSFAQSTGGGGGVPGGPSGGAVSSVFGRTGAVVQQSGDYTGNQISTNLPGTPNAVYSFVATGDQTGTTLHDITTNGNNGAIQTGTAWTGTGLNMQSTGSVSLPTTLTADQTYCATMYAPPILLSTYGGLSSLILRNDPTNTQWSYNDPNPNGQILYEQGAYSNFTSSSYTLTQQATPAGVHTLCWVQGSPDNLYTDGIVASPYNNHSGSSVGQASGFWKLGASSGMTFYYFASWAGQLTAAQVLQASTSMTAAVTNRGVQTVTSTSPTMTPTLIADGDSITNLGGATTTTEWWPSLLSISSTYTVNNQAFPSTLAYTMQNNARWLDAPQCATGSAPSFAIVFAGTNDIAIFSLTPQNTYNILQGYVNILKSAGCQVGVGTMLSRTGFDTQKDALNALIRTNASAGGYVVVDFAAVANLGADGASTNTTWFVDGTHPTNAGQVELGAAASNAINANGIGSATAASPTLYSSNTVTMASADRYATITPTAAAATAQLPDCLGVTGTPYQIFNNSAGANTITFSGLSGEAIIGSTTLTQGSTAIFTSIVPSPTAGGCQWLRSSGPAAVTAAAFNPQSLSAGPYISFFDDFVSGAAAFSQAIGSASGLSCSQMGTKTDINHAGEIRVLSGTGASGTGALCTVGTQGQTSFASLQTGPAWTWESVVFPEFLPGTQSGAYQAGLVTTGNVNPWTTGIGFYLSSANANANHYYCGYGSTLVDSTASATLAWTRLTMVQNGTNLLWYINGTQVCSVAVASLPTTAMSLAWTGVTLTASTANAMDVDYVMFQRASTR